MKTLRRHFVPIIIVSLILLSTAGVSATGSSNHSIETLSLTAMDLAVDIDGFNKYVQEYENYSEYADWLFSSANILFRNILVSDYDAARDCLADDSPSPVLLVKYTEDVETPNWYGYVEIYEYESSLAAYNEYIYQHELDETGDSSMFKRFDYETEFIFIRGNFLIFAIGEVEKYGFARETPYGNIDFLNLMTKYMEIILPILHDEYLPAQPSVSYSGDVVWGIEPGDTMKWVAQDATFTTFTSFEIEWEIADIADNNLAVLIKDTREVITVQSEGENAEVALGGNGLQSLGGVSMEYHAYFWDTVDNSSDGLGPYIYYDPYYFTKLIYPIYKAGSELDNLGAKLIDHLYTQEITIGTQTIHFKGRTYSSSDYTPLETEWRDIWIYRGCGVTKRADFYYADQVYSITTTKHLNLSACNIDFDARPPYSSETPTTTGSTPTTSSGTTTGTTTKTTTQTSELGNLAIPLSIAAVGACLVVVVVVLIKRKG